MNGLEECQSLAERLRQSHSDSWLLTSRKGDALDIYGISRAEPLPS
jgi:hypothetical protein